MEDVRSLLLAKGAELFQRRGYLTTTVADLVAEAGTTEGAFYHHFPSKEAFFVDVMKFRTAQRPEWWANAHNPAFTSLEQVARAALAMLYTGIRKPGIWVLLIGDFLQSLPPDSPYVDAIQERHVVWMGELTKFLDILVERGMVRDDIPTTQLAQDVFATYEGAFVHVALYGYDPDLVATLLVRILEPR